jgi:hypothetical protein
MATATGFSHTTIRRIWTAFGLQPHRTETFKLSSDPLFVDKVRDIVGLYLSPPNRVLVLSVDEKSIQALDREQPVLPMMPGIPERRTHSYVRHGTTSLFAALDVESGFVIGKCYKRHRAAEFLDFLKQIDARVPDGLDIHIIMDNTPPIKLRRSNLGWRGGPTTMCTSRQHRRRGSIRSNVGSPSSPESSCVAVSIPQRNN